ncbi:MAG TPA: NADH-quinone oxidoreductase subunit L [Planctomycetota bacterium]|nr:NADH-quinone oxidoreductase subunit L [Planctomycetota bacterium]
MSHFLWLIPVLPLAGFLVNGLFKLDKRVAAVVGCAGPIGSFAISLLAFLQILFPKDFPVLTETVFSWISVGDLSVPFGLRVDPLSGIMILVVTGVGSLIHLYSVSYMDEDEGFSRFFAYLNLFMFSMLLLVLGDSILLMFVGWEGVGLCSYLLIGFWYKELKNADAGKKAFITNRIGDFGFLLGIFCLWALYQDVSFAKMAGKQIPDSVHLAGQTMSGQALASWAAFFLFIGACGKSAQIPLYVWLPDAMAGPTPVSALIHAATMVTAGVYMMARMNFLYVNTPEIMGLVVIVASLTALLGGLIAVAQNDIKKVLAYSTVSQLGFMFAGIASGEFRTGLFHVVTHAFFKALLFLGAGAVIHALHGEQDIRKMGGLGKKLPGLAAVFVAGALALAGLPLSAGFFSKDAILVAVFERASVEPSTFGPAWLILLATAGLTAFYTTRLVLVVFQDPPGHGPGGPAGHAEEAAHGSHELHPPGLLMMGPLVVLAALSFLGGFLLDKPLEHFLEPMWTPVKHTVTEEAVHRAHTLNVGASVAVFVLGAGLGWLLYGRGAGRDWVKRFAEGGGRNLHWLLENKFFVDEIYEYTIIAPVKVGATIVWFLIDRVLIDTILVNGSGWVVYAVGGVLRRTHTGSINVGVLSFVAGALGLLGWVAYQFLFVADIKWQLPFLH